MLKRFLGVFFLFFVLLALWQCARRGSPTGGPKDEEPPKLVKAEPPNMTLNFDAEKIRLYFDEYVKLEDVQNQLIVSPPLKNQPEITPLGSPRKYVEIILKDTLLENTTYTLNFGQSIVDNNEGNPNSFFTYVFSTGDYIDSLSITGVVRDAFDREPGNQISILLYELDTAYTDSSIYKHPPNYIGLASDSTHIFTLNNLKAGQYALMALKDESKNNVFDQDVDKIGFLADTVTLPTDSVFLLKMFREIPNFDFSVPSLGASNKIFFGYRGIGDSIKIKPLTQLPDTVKTAITKERDKDSINYWFTPFKMDSIVFRVSNDMEEKVDTFTVKARKLEPDSLQLEATQRGSLDFGKSFEILANTPIVAMDSSLISMMGKDSTALPFSMNWEQKENKIRFDFEKEPNESYTISMLPGGITDFFGQTNDTISYNLSTGSPAEYGNLGLVLAGKVTYPLLVQLTDESGKTIREVIATETQRFEFNNLNPSSYLIRLIFDTNGNGQWDTGNFLEGLQPEKVVYYPNPIEVRSNWELEQTFTVKE